MIKLDYENNIFTITENGITLFVEPDPSPINPRENNYVTTMLLWCNSPYLGDGNSFETYEEFEKSINDKNQPIGKSNIHLMPIFYDNENKRLSDLKTNNSYQAGVIYMTDEDAKNECYDISDVNKHLLREIDLYNNYVKGDFLCFTVFDEKQNLLHAGQNILLDKGALGAVRDMAEDCDHNYYHLFEKLITAMEKSPQKPRKKFTNCDIFDVLGTIVEKHVQHYKSDFSYDKADLQNAAYSPRATESNFLWLCRPNGTELTTEREAYIKDTRGHNAWIFYGEQTTDPIIAYAVEVKDIDRGRVIGDLYELDYKKHFGQVKENSLPQRKVLLTYRHSNRFIDYEPHWTGKIDSHDLLKTMSLPADLEKWDKILANAQNERHYTQHEEWDLNRLTESLEAQKSEMEME